jgi:tRNA G18 (ribose-2'-O)-methylase SpoU
MTASKDKNSGDFDLPGFKPKPRAKSGDSEGAAERKPRAYRSSRPAWGEGGQEAPPRRSYDKTAGKSAPREEGPRKLKGHFPTKPAWRQVDGERPGRPIRRDADGERPSRSFGDRPQRPYGEKKSYGDRPQRPYGEKKPYGDRPAYDKPRRDFGDRGDRPQRPYGDKKPYGDRKPYGDKKGYGDRPQRSFDRPAAWGDGPKPFKSELSPEIKKFLHLTTEKGRYKDSRFLIEGAKNVADVVELSPEILHIVLVSDGFQDDALKAAVNAKKIRTSVVAASELAALCGTETPQGIVAVANFGALRPDWARINTVTLLDGVQDPGNLGAILRTSAALGMDAVVLGKGTCDPYNPKVVRSSAASLLRMPLETGEDLATKIHFLRTKGFTIVATSPHAKVTLEQAKLRKKVALLFGNEGGGVGENLIDQADETVRIPMKGKVESLNVAVAHGLLTYDLMRLRA